MDCSRAVTLASRKLNDAISTNEQTELESHFGKCSHCSSWWPILEVAEAWKADEAGDPEPLQIVRNRSQSLAAAARTGNRLILETYPDQGKVEDMDEWFVALPTEWIFLTTRRPALRKLVANMKLLASESDSKVVADSLRRLREHIRWADDLAVASGVPTECVYPPTSTKDRSDG